MASVFPIIINAAAATADGSEVQMTVAGRTFSIGRGQQIDGGGWWIGCDDAGNITITGDVEFQNNYHGSGPANVYRAGTINGLTLS